MNLRSKNHLEQKSGNEPLTFNEKPLNYSILDFWKWSVSDILSNATRGILAEFIVATATNADLKGLRTEWDDFDIITPENIKVEVKSSAYLQTWDQLKHSQITFGIKPGKLWDKTTGRTSLALRHADVYVFCLLNHMDKATVDPLNLNQWEFYVISTMKLNEIAKNQKTITLSQVRLLSKRISYDLIGQTILEEHR